MRRRSQITKNGFLQMDYIYGKLSNDISSFSHSDVYILNQEGDINRQNTFEKPNIKSFKYLIDGGMVIKHTKDYGCSYGYDLKSDSRIRGNRELNFTSFNGSSGLSLLDFIDSVIKGDPDIFTKMEDYVFYDIRKQLFEVVEIHVNDTIVDDMFIKTLKKYFPKLEKIRFYNCTIKSECNFSGIKQNLDFSSSVIENIRSFNSCEANINIYGSKIIRISPAVINSQEIILRDLLHIDINIKELFLKCNFPDLESVQIEVLKGNGNGHTYSYENAFIYLPSSAPNLEKIIIFGKVRDLNFLTEFKYLYDFSILSSEDDMGSFLPGITSSVEREKIYERNKIQLEIEKILSPDDDEDSLLAKIELARIKKLSHFLSRISYNESDNVFKNSDIKSLANTVDPLVPYYYECWYDTLVYKKQPSKKDYCLRPDIYHIYNNHLCVCNPSMLYKIDKKQIVKAVPFIYAANGLPITFKSNFKPPRTKEEAKRFKDNYSGNRSTNYEYERFIEELRKLSLEDKIMPLSVFLNRINEASYFYPTPDDFMKFGPAGRKIAYTLEADKRQDERCDYIETKVAKYISLYNKAIMNNYDSFTLEEKKQIYNNGLNSDVISKNDDIDKAVLESINSKTNGMYSKYLNYINGFQTLCAINPYDNLSVDTRDIKKMVLH